MNFLSQKSILVIFLYAILHFSFHDYITIVLIFSFLNMNCLILNKIHLLYFVSDTKHFFTYK